MLLEQLFLRARLVRREKTQQSPLIPSFQLFRIWPRANFKTESINDWKAARCSVRLISVYAKLLGEVYVHGLNRLNAKDKEIAELKAIITKYRTLDIS